MAIAAPPSARPSLPRILILDDLFGRNVSGGRNTDRENLCAQLLLRDASEDATSRSSRQRVLAPIAEAVFCRAQAPASSAVGDWVENDLGFAVEVVRRGWREGARRWALVLLDLCFYTGPVTEASDRAAPGMPEGRAGDDDPAGYFGLTLLDAIHQEMPELPVVILSSKAREEVSLEFSRRGALGFIARDDLRGPQLLRDALWQHGLIPDFGGVILGRSLPTLLALRGARRAGRHRQNLLIRGERGTGKELLARYVHQTSGDAESSERPFIAVNSAVFTPTLFASELFGIEPRTATGVEGKIGVIELAHRGDLFFDEIADMPIEVQAAVLRVLQERRISRVGGREARDVDVRFLSATNVDLEAGTSGFRSDLLDRLRLGGTIWLPPLRDRRGDIPDLVEAIVREAESARPDAIRRDVTPEAGAVLATHDWPGNIRELRTVIFDAVNAFPQVEHLVPGHLRISQPTSSAPRVADPDSPRADTLPAVLEKLQNARFEQRDVGLWAGRLGHWQEQQTRFVARYLAAALEATKRRTPDRPHGALRIHPAVKLMTGDARLTASQAADVVKRLLGPLKEELEGDLAEAYEIAVRLRPKAPISIVGKRTGER
jgi:DNA-binding NtrC family response regulator